MIVTLYSSSDKLSHKFHRRSSMPDYVDWTERLVAMCTQWGIVFVQDGDEKPLRMRRCRHNRPVANLWQYIDSKTCVFVNFAFNIEPIVSLPFVIIFKYCLPYLMFFLYYCSFKQNLKHEFIAISSKHKPTINAV